MTKITKFEKAKQEYIEAWNNHTKTFNSLAFCSDDKLANEVLDCMKKLKELIPQIAETKESFNGIKKVI